MWLLVGLLMISSSGGCGNAKPPDQGPPSFASRSFEGKPVQQTSRPQPRRADAPVIPPVPAQEIPLSSDEQVEWTAFSKWLEESPWSWEDDPNFRRQRPVGLIVLNPDDLLGNEGLRYTIPTTLRYAGGLANANWDVKILLHMTRTKRSDLASLKAVHDKIDKINKEIGRRNSEEAGKLPPEVAPLRKIDAPAIFNDKKSLENLIDVWLARNFLERRKPHEGGHPVTRPPFGGISFSGHGQSANLSNERWADGHRKALLVPVSQFRVAEKDWFDLSKLEILILRKYQAPVWLMTDLCRMKGPGVKDKSNDIPPIDEKLVARRFDNIARLIDDQHRKTIKACESLRANTSAGFLHRGSGVTTLYATHRLFTFEHELQRLLHGYFGTMLERSSPPDDFAHARFKNLSAPTTSITLLQATSWATEQFRIKKIDPENQRPDLSRGPLSGLVVVFSTLRGKDVYQPQYPNLLGGGVSLTSGGFMVPELVNAAGIGGDDEHYGALTVIRKQEKFDGDYRSIIRFKQPFELVRGGQYQLVLLVSASGSDANDSVKFTTGVYDPDHLLLNPSFQHYGTAESYLEPIRCDGAKRLIHVPLTWFNDPAADPKPDMNPRPEVAKFEIQAAPDEPDSNWGHEEAIHVHAVYLVPMTVSDEDLNSDIKRMAANADKGNMCIWNIPIHDEPKAVSIGVGEKETVMTQSTKPYAGWWGAVGEIYPKLYAESRKQQLRFKVDADSGEADEMFMYVCSNKRVMATWKAQLKIAVAREQVIQIADSGLMQEVIVVVRNHDGPVTITRLEIENNPAGNR